MNQSASRVRTTISILLLLCLVIPFVSAQTKTPVRRRNKILEVRKFSGTDRRDSIVQTPQFRSNESGGAKPAQKWGRLFVTYDTMEKWIDELTIEFFIMTMKPDEKTRKNAYSYYNKTVKYVDIEEGRAHKGVVYIRPAALKRYGPIVATACEITVAGEVVSTQSDISKKIKSVKLPPKWWRDDKVMKSSIVTARPSYILNKKESPFSLINIDDYETIK